MAIISLAQNNFPTWMNKQSTFGEQGTDLSGHNNRHPMGVQGLVESSLTNSSEKSRISIDFLYCLLNIVSQTFCKPIIKFKCSNFLTPNY